MNTTENNKLIAEFMGYDMHTPNGKAFSFRIPNGKTPFTEVQDLKYHTSWDWLIPVVIELNNRLSNEFVGVPNDIGFIRSDITRAIFNDDKERTVSLLIKGIKWYNENK
jgi:hypothetical protein